MSISVTDMAAIEKRIIFNDHTKADYCSGDETPCLCNMPNFSGIICTCDEEFGCFASMLTVHEWAWDEQVTSPATLLSKQNREVRFHPGYSSGTAAVRGDSPFKQGNVYYWEIKMLTSLYGTDVMVGVGTKRAELDKSAYQFCSLLGSDKESWGFSYTGRLQHNGKSEWYGPPFGKGSIIGIYLDMWKGTLEFFLNRRPLGVAFKSLQGSVLYPMVCSTAAQSAMRVILSVSHPISLKLLSLQALKGEREAMRDLMTVPGLRNFIASSWWLLSGSRGEEDCDMGIDRCSGGDGLRGRKRRGVGEGGGGGGGSSGGGSNTDDTIYCPHQHLQQRDENGGRRVRRLCLMCDIIL